MEVAAGTLGDFLRSRRARLRPDDVGLPQATRRRTPGLRREEVAALAGVSVDYYTRLEQGRDRHPSASVVEAVATALQLSDDERGHLAVLAGQPVRRPPRSAPRRVRAPVQSLIDSLVPSPAYVLDPAGDVLAWNAAVAAVLFDPVTVPEAERNLVRLTILDPDLRRRWADWDEVARDGVAQLRDAAARHPQDARLRGLVGELLVASPDFARWWQAHEVAVTCGLFKRIDHPEAGELRFHHETLVLHADGQRVVVYLPADDATSAAVARLVPDTTGVDGGLRLIPGAAS